MEVTEQEREQEQQHFFEVLNALRAYDLGALREVTAMKQAVTANAEFLRAVAECAPFGAAEGVDVAELPERAVSALHTSKTISTLHQCVRDWSAEGAAERAQCYGRIVSALGTALPVTDSNRNMQSVLVPGAGLGRLVLELAASGYRAQGNEFSYFMLLVSNFLLNHVARAQSIVLHPWVDNPCNVYAVGDMLRSVAIPDVAPAEMLAANPDANMSMTAGEFVEVYGAVPEAWDAVVTCFFLDTAANALQYVETIHRILRPGGVWVNMGPLLYHWAATAPDAEAADERYGQSVELSYEELKHAILSFGMQFELEERHSCTYAANRASMMQTLFNCVLFVARKPRVL